MRKLITVLLASTAMLSHPAFAAEVDAEGATEAGTDAAMATLVTDS